MAKSSQTKGRSDGLVAENRRARHDFEIQDELEAGIVLLGSEVKSIREGKISLGESFCQFHRGELFLVQAHVAEYPLAHQRNHDPLRSRKLLLHRRELERLQDAVKLDGVSIVPLAIYLKERRIKLKIGLGKGRKAHDKRAAIKEKEQKREMRRALRDHG